MERMENGWLMTKEDVDGLIKVIDKMSGENSEGKCEQIVNNSGNSSETNSERAKTSGFEGIGAGFRKLKENLDKISADFARGFCGESEKPCDDSEIGEDLDGPGCEFEDFDEKMSSVQEFWSSFDRIVRGACEKCFNLGVENGISWEKRAHDARVCAKSGISGVVVKEKPSGNECGGVNTAVDDAKLQLDSALSRYIFEQEGKLKDLVGENSAENEDNDIISRAKRNTVIWKGPKNEEKGESDSVFDEKTVKLGQKWIKTGPGTIIFGENSEKSGSKEGSGADLEAKNDNVNHPNHYKSSNGIECIDAIEASVEGLTGLEAVCTANVLKYIWRWKKKNGLEDLRKAKWYLEKLISVMEGK